MFAVLIDFLFTAIPILLRTVVVKVLLYAVIFLLTSALFSALLTFLPSGDAGLSSSMASLSPHEWFFFDYFSLGFGFPAIVAAYVTRFSVRRVPFLG